MSDDSPISSTERLWELISDIRIAMFTTRALAGDLSSRPMTTQNRELGADNTLWFFMSRSGEPLAELSTDATVNVLYAHPGKDTYVSVSGHAQAVDDPQRKQRLWSPLAKSWFPAGPDDPDLALVKVVITHAHVWEVKESKIGQLIKMARSAITGHPPTDLGESAQVRLR
jgi:general stress protein 26